jgi:hypothetical protein
VARFSFSASNKARASSYPQIFHSEQGRRDRWSKIAPVKSELSGSELDENTFPALALGVEVLAMGVDRIWIGGRCRGVEVSNFLKFFSLDHLKGALLPALRALTGERSVKQIARSLEIDTGDFLRLLSFLKSENLLRHSAHQLPSDKHGVLSKYSRRELEESHLASPNDLKKRATFKIEIVGHDRVATSIASLLFGSGFSSIRLTTDNYGQRVDEPITDIDLGLGIINGTDIGVSKSDRFHEISNRSAIAPLETEIKNGQIVKYGEGIFNPDLIISIGYPRIDYHQRWISEGRTFFIVPGFSQSSITIGPFVVPGLTPCLRCYELNSAEKNFWSEQIRARQMLSHPLLPPVIAATLIAAHTSEAIRSFLDSEGLNQAPDFSHPLLGRELIINLGKSGLAQGFKYQSWSTHPECGCTWGSFIQPSSTRSSKN